MLVYKSYTSGAQFADCGGDPVVDKLRLCRETQAYCTALQAQVLRDVSIGSSSGSNDDVSAVLAVGRSRALCNADMALCQSARAYLDTCPHLNKDIIDIMTSMEDIDCMALLLWLEMFIICISDSRSVDSCFFCQACRASLQRLIPSADNDNNNNSSTIRKGSCVQQNQPPAGLHHPVILKFWRSHTFRWCSLLFAIIAPEQLCVSSKRNQPCWGFLSPN